MTAEMWSPTPHCNWLNHFLRGVMQNLYINVLLEFWTSSKLIKEEIILCWPLTWLKIFPIIYSLLRTTGVVRKRWSKSNLLTKCEKWTGVGSGFSTHQCSVSHSLPASLLFLLLSVLSSFHAPSGPAFAKNVALENALRRVESIKPLLSWILYMRAAYRQFI